MVFYALTCAVIAIAMVQVSVAQEDPEEYLIPHNQARAEVPVSLEPMTWNTTLEEYARNYVQQNLVETCDLVHSDGDYGECLAMSTGDLSPKEAVDMWVGEKKDYDYESNSCNGEQCGHYTQVIWHDSTRIGCAKVPCNTGGTIVICSYDPPGNYIGERPY